MVKQFGEDFGIRHETPHGGVEKRLQGFDRDAAPGENARQQLREAMALRDRQSPRGRAVVEPIAPGAARRRTLHVEKQAALREHARFPCGHA